MGRDPRDYRSGQQLIRFDMGAVSRRRVAVSYEKLGQRSKRVGEILFKGFLRR